MSRFFVNPENIGNNLIILNDADDLHHMMNVLRLKEGDEVVLIGNLQKYVSSGTVTPELKNCYLISVNGQTSNVNAIEAEKNANAPAFNLAGQRVNNSFKGIVIQNGKKIVK